ncbi:hypothetical protein HHI36_004615 [Cryptolaemus montrouzieri]|uniref:Uncharacterized protein n=1 Tax=Cryptolaemus montrouzieri TaxID=559131 RepID=A0ABD2NRQ4_9CUCU
MFSAEEITSTDNLGTVQKKLVNERFDILDCNMEFKCHGRVKILNLNVQGLSNEYNLIEILLTDICNPDFISITDYLVTSPILKMVTQCSYHRSSKYSETIRNMLGEFKEVSWLVTLTLRVLKKSLTNPIFEKDDAPKMENYRLNTTVSTCPKIFEKEYTVAWCYFLK